MYGGGGKISKTSGYWCSRGVKGTLPPPFAMIPLSTYVTYVRRHILLQGFFFLFHHTNVNLSPKVSYCLFFFFYPYVLHSGLIHRQARVENNPLLGFEYHDTRVHLLIYWNTYFMLMSDLI